jgi:hypothetical protein
MNVFLSWSGSKSEAIAEILKKYLPSIINQVKPWLSSRQIDAGARWSAEIAKSLEQSNVGILCVTADNQTAPWILFEAGAISKVTNVGLAIVVRIDLKASEVLPPLSQFQSISLEREDIWKMITTINNAGSTLVPETTLQTTFDALWSRISAEIEGALSAHATKAPARRADHEMIEELLELVRRQDVANQLLVSRTALIDLRLEQKEQRDALGITSASAYSGLYGQAASNSLDAYSRLNMLSSLSPKNTIYTDDTNMTLLSTAPLTTPIAAPRDVEHDTDHKDE